MARVLVRVKKGRAMEFYAGDNFRHHAQVILTPRVETDSEVVFAKQGEFFEVEERDIEAALSYFTAEHPGADVTVYAATHQGVRPAGELVMKKITKDGILPA